MAAAVDLRPLFKASAGPGYQNACGAVLSELIEDSPELIEGHVFQSDKLNPTDLLYECLTQLGSPQKKTLESLWTRLALHLKHFNCQLESNKRHLEALFSELHDPKKRDPDQVLIHFNRLIQRSSGEYRSFLIRCLNSFIKNCIDTKTKLAHRKRINTIFTEKIIKTLKRLEKLPKKIEQHVNTLIQLLGEADSPEQIFNCLMEINQLLLGEKTKNKKTMAMIRSMTEQQDHIYQWLNETREDKLQFVHLEENPDTTLFLDSLIKYYLIRIRDVSKAHNEKLNKFWRRNWHATKELFNFFWSDFFETPDEKELILSSKYSIETQELLNYKEGKNSRIQNDDDYRSQFFAMIQGMGTTYIKRRNHEYGYNHDYPFTIIMRDFLDSIRLGFPEKKHIQRTLMDTLRGSMHGDLIYYWERREKKELYHHYRFDMSAISYILSDFFHLGGKKWKGNVYDGRQHRLDACNRLKEKLISCKTANDYLGYIAQCLNELNQIKTKDSRLKKIIHHHIIQLINNIIIPHANTYELGIAYQMLRPTCSGSLKKHLRHFVQYIDAHAEITIDEAEEEEQLEKALNLIVIYIKPNTVTAVADEADKGTMQCIRKTEALNTFYSYAQNTFNSRLLAFKVASTGIFKTNENFLGNLAQWIPCFANKAAAAVGLGAVGQMGCILSDVLQYGDRKIRGATFKSMKQLLDSTDRIDVLSHHVMKDYTKIWQHQILAMARGDMDNVKIFADCIIERIMHYLTNEVYLNYPEIPLEQQLCLAARTQRIRHTAWKTRLVAEGDTTQWGKGAFIVEEMLDITPIEDTNTREIYESVETKKQYGCARDGLRAAQLLNFTKTGKVNIKQYILTSPYKNTPIVRQQPVAVPPSAENRALQKKNIQLEKKVGELEQTIAKQGHMIHDLYKIVCGKSPEAPAPPTPKPAVRQSRQIPATPVFSPRKTPFTQRDTLRFFSRKKPLFQKITPPTPGMHHFGVDPNLSTPVHYVY